MKRDCFVRTFQNWFFSAYLLKVFVFLNNFSYIVESNVKVTWLVFSKNQPANVGDVRDLGSISELGRYPGGGNGNPLRYSCLENSKDRGTWQSITHGVTKSQTWLSTHSNKFSKGRWWKNYIWVGNNFIKKWFLL